jgi:hypothetical protein
MLNKNHHREICEQLTAKWQEDKFRRQQEIQNIGKPNLADLVLGWIFAIVAVTGVVCILLFVNNR